MIISLNHNITVSPSGSKFVTRAVLDQYFTHKASAVNTIKENPQLMWLDINCPSQNIEFYIRQGDSMSDPSPFPKNMQTACLLILLRRQM